MAWSLLLPVFIGFAIVLQGGLNRKLAGEWGLAGATLLNNAVLLAAGLALFALVRAWPLAFPEAFRGQSGGGRLAGWYLLPGLCGFAVVVGIPYAFLRLGALRVIVLLIGAQILGSALWDLWVEGRELTPARAAGALITLAGAALTAWKG